MALHNHRPPRQRSVFAGMRGDIELSQHQVKVILQALEEASVDSMSKNLGAEAADVQEILTSVQDPLEAMDYWFEVHCLWLQRASPFEKDPSEEGLVPVTTEGPEEESTFVLQHEVPALRCRWCRYLVHDCDKKPEQCLGASIRNKPEVNDG